MLAIRLDEKRFLVISEAEHMYIVDVSKPACTCPHFLLHAERGETVECKHIKRVRIAMKEGEIIEIEENQLRKLLKRLFTGPQSRAY